MSKVNLVRETLGPFLCFSALYGPRKEVSFDEMSSAFKGRSILKVYNPQN